MATRPPTLREKHRYILVLVQPSGTGIDRKDLHHAVCDAVTSLWGDVTAAAVRPAIVVVEEDFAIIRCRRGMEQELTIALATIQAGHSPTIALRIIAASGTIDSLRERMQGIHQPDPVPLSVKEFTIGEKKFSVQYCNGQKIDVIEKGFKNTHRLFLAREDLEEF